MTKSIQAVLAMREVGASVRLQAAASLYLDGHIVPSSGFKSGSQGELDGRW
jgi:hypothetical protein